MSAIAWLKQFFRADYEEGFEIYRPEFEEIKRADNPSVNLSKVDAKYVDQTVQRHWLDWSTEQHHMNAPM